MDEVDEKEEEREQSTKCKDDVCLKEYNVNFYSFKLEKHEGKVLKGTIRDQYRRYNWRSDEYQNDVIDVD